MNGSCHLDNNIDEYGTSILEVFDMGQGVRYFTPRIIIDTSTQYFGYIHIQIEAIAFIFTMFYWHLWLHWS